jgi:hypothetical protein
LNSELKLTTMRIARDRANRSRSRVARIDSALIDPLKPTLLMCSLSFDPLDFAS